MNRCIELAKNGLGRTTPNPVVGSVIVHNNQIIGEGWHQKAGQAHAEVNAVNSVKNKKLLSKATIYVSLEPCSHYGKTPPCTNLIIESGIKKVVIGTVDPFKEVSGRGIKKLLDAGCEVRVGILEKACRDLNKRFITFHTRHRPYIILKWAQSKDNYISPLSAEDNKRAPVWITERYARQLVHKWRSEEQAILVGTNTAVTDDPQLNIRLWSGKNPVRVVLDRNLRIPLNSKLFDNSIKTIVLTERNADQRGRDNLIFEKVRFDNDLAQQICKVLYNQEIQSVIIEGGKQTLQTFIDSGIWDEARIFYGRAEFGSGVGIPEFFGKMIEETSIGNDHLKIYMND